VCEAGRSKFLNAYTMPSFIVKSYSPKNQILPHSFYVLNRGLNSGKPLLNPCPNCFVITAKSDEVKEFLFQLSDGLWRSKFYHPYLVGSVIVLLRIGDLKSILADKSDKAFADFAKHQKTIKTLRTYDELEKNYLKNLALIQDAKKIIYYRYLHRL
jgi:hypothetical protein